MWLSEVCGFVNQTYRIQSRLDLFIFIVGPLLCSVNSLNFWKQISKFEFIFTLQRLNDEIVVIYDVFRFVFT